jgi:hypothetical protein
MIFTHLFIVCEAQNAISADKITLTAFFSNDNIVMGDSLKITISFKNNSEDTLKLYPEGRVSFSHYHPNVFIHYSMIERIAYILREYSNRDSIVWLKQGEEIQYAFDITAKNSFFYVGENTVYVQYRNIWDKPVKKKQRQKTEQEPVFFLYSPPIKITVIK